MSDIKRLLTQSAGLRAYSIRVGILNKTKKYFSSKYNILSNSIKQYEESPIIKSVITGQKIYEAFLLEGVKVSESWFFDGVGELPFGEEICSKIFYEIDDQESKACTDILLFKSRYCDSEIMTVEDNLNTPYYNYGDHVGFIWRKLSQVDSLNKVVCAIEINDGICIRVCTKISNNKVRVECNKLQNRVVMTDLIGPIIFHRPAKCYRLINMNEIII
ncbi:hypothetical protein [Silvanigrella aquatica]|uniref:Peptidase S24/S26A/S26B/S26C domain-containing protein n=1 Tax=Silvanigrella aquatica TaxID=1915309 RepID=A0A1L4D2Q7_9BACT|nr:hypothetical protein [Silvanigrella aquatica]APJ04480.1 hypothetical protein AXG55_11395 [Silvanigrella aquatica]